MKQQEYQDYVSHMRMKKFEKKFPLVEASKLSLDDDFMKFEPFRGDSVARKLKENLTNVIKFGIEDFRVPFVDPTIYHDQLRFVTGYLPAVGYSPKFWTKKLKRYMRQYNSRMGTKRERIAFMGVLIKMLCLKGISVEEAWNWVCINSFNLGKNIQWFESEESVHLGKTGCSGIGDFMDLGNVRKIVYDEVRDSYILSGMDYNSFPYYYLLEPYNPLAKFEAYDKNKPSVGWMVMSKDPVSAGVNGIRGFLDKIRSKISF